MDSLLDGAANVLDGAIDGAKGIVRTVTGSSPAAAPPADGVLVKVLVPPPPPAQQAFDKRVRPEAPKLLRAVRWGRQEEAVRLLRKGAKAQLSVGVRQAGAG